MQKLKAIEWTDLALLLGVACVLYAAYQLVGESWTLLLFGLLLVAVSAVADLRAPRR